MTLAESLKESIEADVSPPHLIVEARAGTGKTTTLIEGLKLMRGLKTTLVPSPQQAAVWEAMQRDGQSARRVCFVAFNRSIADELKKKVPAGCEAMTMHGMGNRILFKAFGKLELMNNRVEDIIAEVLEKSIWDLKQRESDLLKNVKDLVDLCKQNLIGFSDEYLNGKEGARGFDHTAISDDDLDQLCSRHEIELNGKRRQVFDLVPKVLNRCLNVLKDRRMDYADMIWLPLALGLPLTKYDRLLVDEAQDLNRCQQQLALRSAICLILCGDTKQAIYGFAGADSDSLINLQNILKGTPRGCTVLPLTVTRRCGKAIVAEAQKIVPDFEAFETNPPGEIKVDSYKDKGNKTWRNHVKVGDMVLCRVNAPLISQCFRFLKAKIPANIQGRDIGSGLIKLIERMQKKAKLSVYTVTNLLSDLDNWYVGETQKENCKKFPNEAKLISITDKRDCLECFIEDASTVEEVINKINEVFTDAKTEGCVRLSSVHKAKGLEAENVFILMPKGSGMPHPMAKAAWEIEQEYNLKYVAITRAIKTLTWVWEK